MSLQRSKDQPDGIGRRLILKLGVASLPLQGLQTAWAQAAAELPTLAVCQDFYPYTGVADGKAVGFSVDLVRAAFAAVGVTANYRLLPYPRCLAEAERGLVLGCFAIGREADSFTSGKLIAHRTPMSTFILGLFVNASSKLQALRLQDMKNLRVAVAKDAAYGEMFERSTQGIRIDVLNEITGLRMLARGRVDAALLDQRSCAYLVRSHREEFAGLFRDAAMPGSFPTMFLHVGFSAVRPESQRYADLMDQGLAAIKASGAYERISGHWSPTLATGASPQDQSARAKRANGPAQKL